MGASGAIKSVVPVVLEAAHCPFATYVGFGISNCSSRCSSLDTVARKGVSSAIKLVLW